MGWHFQIFNTASLCSFGFWSQMPGRCSQVRPTLTNQQTSDVLLGRFPVYMLVLMVSSPDLALAQTWGVRFRSADLGPSSHHPATVVRPRALESLCLRWGKPGDDVLVHVILRFRGITGISLKRISLWVFNSDCNCTQRPDHHHLARKRWLLHWSSCHWQVSRRSIAEWVEVDQVSN